MNMDNGNMDMTEMVLIMFVAGFLSTMNIWANDIKDVKIHINDFYMVALMIGWSILLSSLLHLNQTQNYAMLIASISLVLVILYLIRTQTFVDDQQYLNGMISHHSMAVTMSDKINDKTTNPKIKELSNNIIRDQKNEIKLMNSILAESDKK
jgi:hypothetical protein